MSVARKRHFSHANGKEERWLQAWELLTSGVCRLLEQTLEIKELWWQRHMTGGVTQKVTISSLCVNYKLRKANLDNECFSHKPFRTLRTSGRPVSLPRSLCAALFLLLLFFFFSSFFFPLPLPSPESNAPRLSALQTDKPRALNLQSIATLFTVWAANTNTLYFRNSEISQRPR